MVTHTQQAIELPAHLKYELATHLMDSPILNKDLYREYVVKEDVGMGGKYVGLEFTKDFRDLMVPLVDYNIPGATATMEPVSDFDGAYDFNVNTGYPRLAHLMDALKWLELNGIGPVPCPEKLSKDFFIIRAKVNVPGEGVSKVLLTHKENGDQGRNLPHTWLLSCTRPA